jgi:2-phosphoglycolate phosphatase
MAANPNVKPVTKAVLFDLDGTLLDTAPDMARALNKIRAARDLPPLPVAQVRPHVSRGARGMVAVGFKLTPEDAGFAELRDAFLDTYEQAVCVDTALFDGMESLLQSLERNNVEWGIVTNKSKRFTLPLLSQMKLDQRAACIVCGDTTPHAKPHPEPLLHACRELGITPAVSIYVGDDVRDIQAAHAAHMRVLAARYGYIGVDTRPEDWKADGIIDSAEEVLDYL